MMNMYDMQYLLFHYQFKKSEGFTIDWEQFDYVFRIRSFDNPPRRLSDTRSNGELIREETLFAIEKHNKAKGTKLVFVEHIQANYPFLNGFLSWLIFWAMDMNSSSPESKIYQAKIWRLRKRFKIIIFRLKPTEEDEIAVVFARAGHDDDLGVPLVFHRTGGGVEVVTESEENE